MSNYDEDIEALRAGRNRLYEDLSKLPLAIHLAQMKVIYDRAYDTGPGGDRTKQTANVSFCDFMAETRRHCPKTIGNYARRGRAFLSLDDEVQSRIAGSPVANELDAIVRIAQLERPRQLKVIDAFVKGRQQGRRLLEKFNPKKPRPPAPSIPSSELKSTDSSPRKASPATFGKDRQLEGVLRKTGDGMEDEFLIGDKLYRLVVFKNHNYVLVEKDAAPDGLLKPLRKSSAGSTSKNEVPLTPSMMRDAITRAVGNAAPPRSQVHGTDVMFKVGARTWTVSWWPRKEATGKVEVSHLSAAHSVGTVCGPLTLARFEQHLAELLAQVRELGS